MPNPLHALYGFDDDVVTSVADDLLFTDAVCSVRIICNTGSAIDWSAGNVTITTTSLDIPYCVRRNATLRQTQSVKQLTGRQLPLQNDDPEVADMIFEVPATNEIKVSLNDSLIDLTDNTRYYITAIDIATLRTRWRFGCRRIL